MLSSADSSLANPSDWTRILVGACLVFSVGRLHTRGRAEYFGFSESRCCEEKGNKHKENEGLDVH